PAASTPTARVAATTSSSSSSASSRATRSGSPSRDLVAAFALAIALGGVAERLLHLADAALHEALHLMLGVSHQLARLLLHGAGGFLRTSLDLIAIHVPVLSS